MQVTSDMVAPAGQPRNGSLLLVFGATRYSIEPGRVYRLGRGEGNDIRVDHASVSELHCTLHAERDGLLVEDCGSQHGTLIDGHPVERGLVRPGQCLRLGGVEIEVQARSAPLPLVRRAREPSLGELVRSELQRTPWFTLSLAIHLALLLLLRLWLEVRPSHPQDGTSITIAEDRAPERLDQEQPRHTELPQVEDHVVDIEYRDSMVDEPSGDSADAAPSPDPGQSVSTDTPGGMFGSSGGVGWMTKVGSSGDGLLGNAAVAAGGFSKTVTELRKSGLEIVFAFDSTSSMGAILRATKERIAHLAEILHQLVPDARIGVVTYRDRGGAEEYLTRAVPLSDDFYRAINFMQVVRAGGGGDTEEAVLDGLRAAFAQPWRPKARRVVVLVGDAAPHAYDMKRLLGAVSTFATDGHSFVHAIVTGDNPDRLSMDTLKAFGRIAQAGHGQCLGFEDQGRILQQILSLAFGVAYRKNLDEVSRLVQQRRDRVATAALDVVFHDDLDRIDTALNKSPVDDEMVKALQRCDSSVVAQHLVELLVRQDIGEPCRQAAGHALQDMLGLEEPPSDPDAGGPIGAELAKALRARIARTLTTANKKR